MAAGMRLVASARSKSQPPKNRTVMRGPVVAYVSRRCIVEDGCSGVLGRPYSGITRGGDFPVHDRHTGLWIVNEGLCQTLGTGFLWRGLAEEVIFLHRGETGMRIAAADEAKLVGIHAQRRFKFKTVLQRGARILELKHLLRLCHAAVKVALVPDFKIGELIIG